MTTFYKVGKIVNTQGLRGEVRVISTTDFAEERYKKGTELAIFKDGEFLTFVTVASHRRHKNFDLLTFEGMNRIEDVEKYKGRIGLSLYTIICPLVSLTACSIFL